MSLVEVRKRKLKERSIEKVETFEVFDYQEEASLCIVKHLELQRANFEILRDREGRVRTCKDFLPMATGLGKTRTSIEVIKKVSRKPKKILIIVDQTQLLEDHKKVFNAYMGHEYSMTDFTGKSFIQRKDTPEYEVIFATRQSLRNYIDSENTNYLSKDYFDFILDDESHHAKAKTYEPTLNYFEPEYLLGMTGTPDRSDWKDIRDIFGESSVDIARKEAESRGDFDSYNYTLENSIRLERLTPLDYDLVTMDIDEEELDKLIAEKGKNLTKEELEKLIFQEKSLEEVLQHMIKAVGAKHTGIMCDSIQQAEDVSRILRDWGYVSESFHSKSGDDGGQLVRFRQKNSKFLSAVNKINEGVDIPEMEAIVFLRSTNSKTIFLQQLGRVLRKYPGKERALVLDYVGTIDRLELINQLILDTESDNKDSEERPINYDRKIHGGRNVFRFNRGIVSKISEILKRNERRDNVSKERIEDAEVISDPKEIKKFLVSKKIKCIELYNLWSVVVDDEKRKLPSLEELKKMDIFSQLRLKKYVDLSEQDQHFSWDGLDWVYDSKAFSFKKVSPILKGISNLKMSKKDIDYVSRTILEISDGTIPTIRTHPIFDLPLEEGRKVAVSKILKILKEMSKVGLLVNEVMYSWIFHQICLDVLYDVHSLFFGDPEFNEKAKKGPFKGRIILPEELDQALARLETRKQDRSASDFSLSETKIIVKNLNIKTVAQYDLVSVVVFPGHKEPVGSGKLPSLTDELKNILDLKTFDELTDLEKSQTGDFMMMAYNTNIFSYNKQLPAWRKHRFHGGEVEGISEFRSTKELRKVAEDTLLRIAEEKDVNIYGLHLEEAKEAAKKCINYMIDSLEINGLLTKSFFAPEILNSISTDILYQIHMEYFGNARGFFEKERTNLKYAKYGPYTGSKVFLSEVLAGKRFEMSLKKSQEKARELKIKTSYGYKMWSQRVFPSNLILAQGFFRFKDGRMENRFGLKEISEQQDISKEIDEDVENFLNEHLIFFRGNFGFSTEINLISVEDSIKGKIKKDEKEGISKDVLSEDDEDHLSSYIKRKLTLGFDRNDSDIANIILKVLSIYKILSDRKLYSLNLKNPTFIESILKYVLKKMGVKMEIKTGEIKVLDVAESVKYAQGMRIDDIHLYKMLEKVVIPRGSEDVVLQPYNREIGSSFFLSMDERQENFKVGIRNYLDFVFEGKFYSNKDRGMNFIIKKGISNYNLDRNEIQNFGRKFKMIMQNNLITYKNLKGDNVMEMIKPKKAERVLYIWLEMVQVLQNGKLLTEDFFDEEVMGELIKIILSKVDFTQEEM